MATKAPSALLALAEAWERLFSTATFSGLVGDLSHAQRGGYHISVQDQVNDDNYSVVRPDDKAPPGTWARDCASAIDMNLGLADMKVCHSRLVAVWKNRADDPRAKYINAHNGWNGDGNAGRYDWYSGAVKAATDDHKWHIHLEVRRRYANDPKVVDAVLSILRGETVAEYLEVDMTNEEWARLEALFAGVPGAVWAAAFGRDTNRRTAGQILLETRTSAADAAGLDEAELDELRAVAADGTADALEGLPEAVVAAVKAALPADVMDRAEVIDAVEAGVRNAFEGGLAPETPVPPTPEV